MIFKIIRKFFNWTKRSLHFKGKNFSFNKKNWFSKKKVVDVVKRKWTHNKESKKYYNEIYNKREYVKMYRKEYNERYNKLNYVIIRRKELYLNKKKRLKIMKEIEEWISIKKLSAF
jgi:hypothetical protein